MFPISYIVYSINYLVCLMLVNHPCPLAMCPWCRVVVDPQLYPKGILIPPTALLCVVQHWQGLPGSDEKTWHERAAGLSRSHQDPP